jgi:hypothetical protein
MTHLTPDELIDAMEADADNSNAVRMLAPDRQSHLATCDVCQRELAGLSSVLSDAKQTSIPEPSPLFWPHFSERVRTAIDADANHAGNWPSWMRWQVLLPLGAVAMIILALAMNMRPANDRSDDMIVDSSPAMDLPSDNWVMITELVGPIDLDTASAAVVIEPGVAERAVLHLTSEEQQELTRLLKAELQRAKS